MIRVLERLALMGPNLYAHRPCIKWKLDIGDLEQRPSNTLPHFNERLKRLVPALAGHRCSEEVPGGFFLRLDEGTWAGHIIEHIALALQETIGIDVGFGKTRSAGADGVYNVVYACEERETGILAGEIAIDIVETLADDRDYDLAPRLAELRRTNERAAFGPSTRSIVEAAGRRGIPHIRLEESSLVQFGYGANARRIQATIASTTRFLGVEIAGDKDRTKNLLAFHGVPVPKGGTARSFERALELANEIGWPVVVKPLDASQGRGIVTNVRCEEELRIAFEDAKRHRATVIIERYLHGADYRLLVINHRFVAAAKRVPATVTGDGRHTIAELVDIANQDERRGEGHEKVLTRIKIDDSTRHLLALRGMSPESIPREGQEVCLKTTANLSTGGTAIDVTDRVHPANIELAERITRLVDLDICGIDVVAPSIETPILENGGGIVEVNAAPGFRMHMAPTVGKPRPVGDAVVDMLFPSGCTGRIPIVTVTGTNGKTTTARLCAHIARMAGKSVGLTTSDGIYIRSQLVQKGDTTGPASAAVVLRDPSVNFAVLETARGGILRSGLGYDWSNAAIITNIAADHLGMRDINTLEDLAHVKAVTVERVFPDGYAILNAEDGMTPLIRKRIDCRLALFSLDAQNAAFREHVDAGGLGATIEDGWICVFENGVRVTLCEARRVPISFNGRAKFNLANALAATLATFTTNIATTDIASGLLTFFQSAETTPGRLNFIDMDGFRVLIDYAHNPHGLTALTQFVREVVDGRLIAVFGLPGDRRDEDLRASARVIAGACDHVVIREDHDLRGRRPGEVPGIIRQTLLDSGFEESSITVRQDEREAFEEAFRMAMPGDLIVFIADKPEIAARIVEETRKARLRGGAVLRGDGGDSVAVPTPT
jgi:cyanophycin synthetase